MAKRDLQTDADRRIRNGPRRRGLRTDSAFGAKGAVFRGCFWFALCALPSYANVTLPALLSAHAVLQRSKDTRIWGKADPGERVRVEIAGVAAETDADSTGRWKASLDLTAPVGTGPYELVVRGNNRVTVPDFLLGEVWVCSGQSNMEWTMNGTETVLDEIAEGENAGFRQFTVKRSGAKSPKDDCEGDWMVAGPDTVRRFTAVGYYFGKMLHKRLGVPVGLIDSSAAGTFIEPWISRKALESSPDLRAGDDRLAREAIEYTRRLAAYRSGFEAWSRENDRADRPVDVWNGPIGGASADKGWQTMVLPGRFAAQGLPDAGAFWVCKKIIVPRLKPIGLDRGFLLTIGNIYDFHEVYWNGVKIGQTGFRSEGATMGIRYRVPDALVHEGGEATIAIRIFAPGGGAGIESSDISFTAGSERLAGAWWEKTEYTFGPLSQEAKLSYPREPLRPPGPGAGLFNAMIHPLTFDSIRGVVWYQGENNAGTRAYQYRTTFPLMIEDWRSHWGEGAFPFYFCQLANSGHKSRVPGESAWAELRESQSLTLRAPNTGEAVLIDVGEEANEHPRDKREVGARLARIALARDYGVAIPFQGPTPKGSEIVDGKVRIQFDHSEQGLVARPLPESYRPTTMRDEEVPLVRNSPKSELEGFAICGSDKKWVWADAKIDGNSVFVWSERVPHPVAVRYAWAENPTCNLYNSEGLPAAPFRTDDFPLTSRNLKY
jgi:sialate O-acetylesterase